MTVKMRDIKLGHDGIVTIVDGQLDRYADGGYPFVYYQADGSVFCVNCANQVDCTEPIIGADIFYEGAPEICEGCGKEIESAYGDPDAEPEELPASDRWSLSDDGTLDTVLACNVCQYEERFSNRGAAAMFIEDDEECPVCAGVLV